MQISRDQKIKSNVHLFVLEKVINQMINSKVTTDCTGLPTKNETMKTT